MNSINFSWDDRKNRANQNKYKISFEEAQTVFLMSTLSNILTLTIQNPKIDS